MKVAQAVHVLNHDTQSCNRVAANQWLVQFQQTDAAWEVATSILTSDHQHQHPQPLPFVSDFEVEFFAAQILKRKVFFFFKKFCSPLCFALKKIVMHFPFPFFLINPRFYKFLWLSWLLLILRFLN